mgnify:CR=1 FL=1
MSSDRSRIVFETSTLVGAVLRPQSVPAQALELAIGAGELIASEQTLEELVAVLARTSLDRFRAPSARTEFLALYRQTIMMLPVTVTVADCRDPKDDKFLSLAVSGGASVIVSSDSDLLVLDPYREIAVLSPAQFISLNHDESQDRRVCD